MDESSTTPRVAILASPGLGHLIPLVEFAKRLILHHPHFSVTLILPSTHDPLPPPTRTFLRALPTGIIDHILLPPVNLDDLPHDVKIETRISLTVARSLPSLRDALQSLINTKLVHLAALVVDLFGTDAFDVAEELHVPPYIFYPSTATALSFFLYLPKLHHMVPPECEFRELPDPILIPGCFPIQGRDLLDPAQDRKDDAYNWLLHHSRRYSLARGILVNSFPDLESGPLKALTTSSSLHQQQQGEGHKQPPVYPVGPLTRRDGTDEEEECLKWLDDQPSGSVLFVSFGSGGTLSHHQLTEVALGLEMSQQRFLWVVRSPNDAAADAAFFSVQTHETENDHHPLAFMPQGFLDRIKGRGFVTPSWVPQPKILGHGSTGGFLTHCGWNSVLESVVEGVPLIAWPLYAEQKMNAVMLVEDLKVALRPRTKSSNENGWVVGRVEIANVVKGLMEGEEGKRVRARMKELKGAAAKVLLTPHSSSTQALAQVACKWQTNISTPN